MEKIKQKIEQYKTLEKKIETITSKIKNQKEMKKKLELDLKEKKVEIIEELTKDMPIEEVIGMLEKEIKVESEDIKNEPNADRE